ncbi:MAG: hypothetical protein ACREQQ_08475 [Candidatus Binatia bacterium]
MTAKRATGTGMRGFRRARLGRLLLVVVSLSTSAIAVEAALRSALDPVDVLRPELIADDVLGFRIRPGSNGHDALGCRNRSVPASADVLAIGDSFTYGQGATLSESWPAALARRLATSVYNLATPGYGPAHYCHLLERHGVRLEPRLVIVGFYYGNDLENAAATVYARDHWKELRDPDVPAASLADTNVVKASDAVRGFARWKLHLQERSFLYRFVDLGLKEMNRQLTAHVFPALDDDFVRIADGVTPLHTSLTPGKRIRALDLSDLRIAEGLRLSLAFFRRMRALCGDRGIDLAILLLPTKEGVLADYLERSGILAQNPKLERAIAAEREVDRRVKRFLDEHEIDYFDPREALAAAIGRELVYSTDLDGHPNPAGYAVIAESVAEAIASRGLLDSRSARP